MSKKHSSKVPDFSSHKQQRMKPKADMDTAHVPPPPPPPVVPKAHAVKTSGHRGA